MVEIGLITCPSSVLWCAINVPQHKTLTKNMYKTHTKIILIHFRFCNPCHPLHSANKQHLEVPKLHRKRSQSKFFSSVPQWNEIPHSELATTSYALKIILKMNKINKNMFPISGSYFSQNKQFFSLHFRSKTFSLALYHTCKSLLMKKHLLNDGQNDMVWTTWCWKNDTLQSR